MDNRADAVCRQSLDMDVCDKLPACECGVTCWRFSADGQFHSGEAMGLALGVSRMAVWKHIRALRECGVPLEVVRAQGYRLPAAVELLDASAIQDGLEPGTRDRLASVDTFLDLDSTNTWLRQTGA